MYNYLDAETATKALYDLEHVYIVSDTYLVAYQLATPWWANSDAVFLEELLVLRLAVSDNFDLVPQFLADRAREAGAQLVVAGTALAKSDRALASLYHRAGYSTQAFTLVKEP